VYRFLLAQLVATQFTLIGWTADFATLDGKRLSGDLSAIDSTHATVMVTGSTAPLKLPFQELASVEFRKAFLLPTGTAFDEIELIDGSLIKVSKLAIRGKQIEPILLTIKESPAPPSFQLPLNSISGFLRGADNPAHQTEWKKLLANRSKRDQFVVRQADGLNPLSGTVIEGTEAGDGILFEREDGQRITLKLSRASGGIVFNQAPREGLLPKLCKVFDAYGNSWVAARLEVVGGGLKVTTVSGAVVTYPTLAGVYKLDFAQGNVTYLSVLDAVVEYATIEKDGSPAVPVFFQRQISKDRSVDYSELIIDGKKYTRGLSIPPDTSLTYKLDGNFRDFKFTPGIRDGAARESWALKLVIEVDGRVAFDELITKKAKPREVPINIKDAKLLKILVERDGLFVGEQLNLGDARVQK
jgi:NPCBM/NEW2 domain